MRDKIKEAQTKKLEELNIDDEYQYGGKERNVEDEENLEETFAPMLKKRKLNEDVICQ